MYILGISAYYHDSGAALIKDEEIIAAAQEERFTRKKHDPRFPKQAILYCLAEAGIGLREIEHIAFYDKPFIKFERLLETYLSDAPIGLRSFVMAIPIWLKEKLFLKNTLVKSFAEIDELPRDEIVEKLMFGEHHQSHAASAFYPSPFAEAAILTIDGVGEWATTSFAFGKGNHIEILKEIHFPHSLGLLYSAFTYYTGFKVNSGEYKVMGLAPYGRPIFVDTIKDHLIDIKMDGSYKLNMDYFNYTSGLTMTGKKFHKLFGARPKKRESEVNQVDMDLAASIQAVTEEVVSLMAKHARKESGSENLCMAGGVALNCVSNGKLLREDIFKNIWIQPAAGDAGGAVGSAYSVYYEERKHERTLNASKMDKMQGGYLGPRCSPKAIAKYLDSVNAVYHYIPDESELVDKVADALVQEKVIGWHCDRMEFGPRALGHRSIIGDARSKKMQSVMNLKIKYRESFRPFAPSVMREKASDWFNLNTDSPYMLLVADVKADKRKNVSPEQDRLFGIEKLNIPRSEIPAVTHVDYSARIQTVHEETNPRYYRLLERFYARTDCPVIVNTSFNVRGEPIVCNEEDSYRCFMRTEMDVLVIDDYLLYKQDQPAYQDKGNWKEEFELD